jgi:hypothetical protein
VVRRSGFVYPGGFWAFVLAVGTVATAWTAAASAAPGIGGAGTDIRMIGEIRGSVTDRTPPSHPVARQPVRLEIVEPAVNSTRNAATDGQGRFVFSGLPVGGGPRIFLVDVEYGGVLYSTRVNLSEDSPAQDVPVSVFIATTDRTAVRGTVAFAVFELVHDALRVSVVQRLDNATDEAVAVTDADPLVFPLPAVSPTPRAALPVEFVEGWRDPRINGNTITDTLPVLPGTTQVAYAFGVAASAPAATLRWDLPYGATDVELLADPSLRISGPDLQADGIVTEQARRYARWSGSAVPAHGSVSVRIDGLPVAVDRWPGLAAGGLAFVLACGLIVALRRRPAAQGRSESPRRRTVHGHAG